MKTNEMCIRIHDVSENCIEDSKKTEVQIKFALWKDSTEQQYQRNFFIKH